MNIDERLDMLEKYVKAGISPILIEGTPITTKKAVYLNANCDKSLLNGHYDASNFVAPNWYNELLEKSKESHCVLVINGLNEIPKEEQIKFIELFKYKKISTFELPKNCVIITTCSSLVEKTISEEVYSLLVHI